MFDFHYNVIKKIYPDNKSKLLFTDTDSLCYQIQTKDIYADMREHKQYFDSSDYPKEHPNYKTDNKKVVGKFKEEQKGNPIEEMCLIRSKCYFYNVHKLYNNIDTHKGVLKEVKKLAAKKLSLTDYKNTLLIDNNDRTNMTKDLTFNLIKNENHLIKSVKITKSALSAYDNKLYYLNMIDSSPYGH